MSGKLKNIDIEDYWNVINYNYGQIQFAEVKATAIISIYSLIFGLGYTLTYWMKKIFILFLQDFPISTHFTSRCILVLSSHL